jgi:Flp pilus assembly protein TadD
VPVPDAPAFDLALADEAAPDDAALAAAQEPPGQDSLAILRRAADGNPEDPDYCYVLGLTLARRGEHAAAVQAFREAVRFPTGEADYHRALGQSLWRLGRFDEAREAFQEALRAQPRDADARNGLALSLLRLDRPTEAAAALAELSDAEPTRAEFRSNLGAALWLAGRHAEAERSFRRALRARASAPAFHRNLGRALLARGRAARAAACFREALRHEPTRAATELDLGDALFAASRHVEAEAAYERALALDPAAVASRPATRSAWQTIRTERARGELQPQASGGLGAFALSRSLDVLHVFESALGLLGSPGQRLATLGLLLTLALALRVGFVVLPHYVAHYRLHDEVVRLTRMPTKDDALVRQRVFDAVLALDRGPYVSPADVRVEATGATRRVSFGYEVEVKPLPGLTARLRFGIRVEEPFEAERPPTF